MGYYRAWRPAVGIVRTIAAASFALLLVVLSVSTAFAGTTGVISGKVTDSSTGAPLADVAVTAASPSGNYTATTNARGFYSMAGVYADTYTLSFQHPGYEPQSEAGVSVFADQVATVSVTMLKSLKTIARVVAHSEASAYQPSQTTD
ncbi:MAG: carboxypeptidase-like regulatory domain-containing protein, partial [Vulcanimicrobiaceae bacterium]